MGARPAWDSRHHLVFSKENRNCPRGQRDYFDRPRDLRIVVPEGHDGIANPFELRPSLHWLKYQESPKMNKQFSSVSSLKSTDSPKSAKMESPKGHKSPSGGGSLNISITETEDANAAHQNLVGVGSPSGTMAKPRFQRTGSWLLEPEVAPSNEKRKIKYTSTHYSEKHGTVKHLKTQKQVPWNNRWHLSPSRMSKLHPAYQEYFDQPSRMYTSSTEEWRHMYGDNCEKWTKRPAGLLMTNKGYGWKGLRQAVERM
jgi:hypothetical protein